MDRISGFLRFLGQLQLRHNIKSRKVPKAGNRNVSTEAAEAALMML